MGVDRHLLGLRAAEQDAGLDQDPFLHDDAVLRTGRWRLSTSNCGNDATQLFGFGPVVPNGYGVGYQIHAHEIDFSVAAWNKPSGDVHSTDPAHFVANLEDALTDILHLAAQN
jgi:hypothetical protein